MNTDSEPRESAENGHILHVTTSASFLPFALDVFEQAAPGRNRVAAVALPPGSLDFIAAPVDYIPETARGRHRLDSIIHHSRIVIFHNLVPSLARHLERAPRATVTVWSGWGGDYYGTTYDYHADQLAPLTRRFETDRTRLRSRAWNVLQYLRHGATLQRAARRADLFSAPIPEDFAVFRRRFPGFDGRYQQLNYVSLEDSIATDRVSEPGPDILVGNSGAPVNNHLDVFDLLATQDLGERRVVVPLSYGNAEYSRAVELQGRRMFGDHFVAITDFLPVAEYNSLLAECGIVVMGHWRQAGMGNILRALWQGAHVVLDRRNPVFEHLTTRGASVLSLDDLSRGVPTGPLGEAERRANRSYLEANWSRRVVVENAAQLIELAT